MKDFYVHFHQEEHAFVDRALYWIFWVKKRCQPVLTPFLDPREREILRSLIQRDSESITLYSDGGYEEAERKRTLLHLNNFTEITSQMELTFLRLETENKERSEHRDVLGSLMGLGIKREMFGDFLPHRYGCDLIMQTELTSLIYQLTKVGKRSITVTEINREELMLEKKRQIKKILVSSLRVDTVIANGFQISRKKANQWMKQGRCKMNWKKSVQPHERVEEGDVLSLRGAGRLRIQEFLGQTKKGKYGSG